MSVLTFVLLNSQLRHSTLHTTMHSSSGLWAFFIYTISGSLSKLLVSILSHHNEEPDLSVPYLSSVIGYIRMFNTRSQPEAPCSGEPPIRLGCDQEETMRPCLVLVTTFPVSINVHSPASMAFR